MKLLIHLISDKRVIEFPIQNQSAKDAIDKIIIAQGFMHSGPAFSENKAVAKQMTWIPYHMIRLITIEE